jgi:hypothetical protein
MSPTANDQSTVDAIGTWLKRLMLVSAIALLANWIEGHVAANSVHYRALPFSVRAEPGVAAAWPPPLNARGYT